MKKSLIYKIITKFKQVIGALILTPILLVWKEYRHFLKYIWAEVFDWDF